MSTAPSIVARHEAAAHRALYNLTFRQRFVRTTLLGLYWGLGVGVFLLFVQGWPKGAGWSWFARYAAQSLVVSYSIVYSIFALFTLERRFLGWERTQAMAPRLRFALFSTIAVVGAAIGWPIGMVLIGQDFIKLVSRHPESLAIFAFISVVSTVIQGLIFFGQAQKLRAEQQAAEAQLRLLQGQIEPHFLFNTLANVLSLMDADTPAARRMLETFIDYLRASLGPMRRDTCSLADELELVRAYLQLLQMRMGERLRFRIEADDDALRVPLPPLVLQPLVENAVHHGLEPKVEGGEVAVRAHVVDRQLVVEVDDDGLGLDAPARPRRRGHGLAITNVRERLAVRFGQAASLELSRREPGTRARLVIPIQPPSTTAAP